jgi:maleate isomerase
MTDNTGPLDYSHLRDVNSSRGKFATLVPSTNTTVEHDFHQIAPKGCTFPVGRMYIPAPTSRNDPEFANIITQVEESLEDAVRIVMTTKPDYLIMGMSAPTFWGGVAGNERFEQRIRDLSGLEVSGGATAIRAALEVLKAKTLAFLSPYQAIGDEHVQRFFEEAGFTVKRSYGFKVPSIDAISSTPQRALIDVLKQLDSDDVDVLVQAGTNLSMLRLADEAERWIGKPVVTVNSATLWHALRAYGIEDRFEGFGTLLRDH